jgi:carboxypeptidase C (cathepsin A)
MLISSLAALLPALAAATSIQEVFPASLDTNPSSTQYKILTHKSHPNHKLRIQSHTGATGSHIHNDRESISKYCAGATSGYTGYLSTENDTKHFYFAYFESRSSPDEDPLLMWINGGPGCSSMMGLLMEQGV